MSARLIRIRIVVCSAAILVCAGWSSATHGQGAAGAEPTPVVIERAPVSIRDAAAFDIPLKLKAARQFALVSHVDGVVQLVQARAGEKVVAQTELCRLDSRMLQLELERAQAAYQAARQEQEKGAVPARVEVARKDMELAQLRLERTITRVPFDAHLFEVHVAEGQFVRAGEPLVTIADQTRLIVEAPVDRRSVKVGDSLELRVEDVTVSGRLTAILPLPERFDPLRPLFQSVAGGIVEIDNSAGRFMAGQTAYSPMIPRQPVTEVPAEAISNADEGERKVQVIRDGVVRDVPVQLLGQVGEQHLWVSGRFAKEDQMILRSSEPLLDGSLVSLQNQPEPQAAARGGAPPRPPAGAYSNPYRLPAFDD